MRGRIAVLRGQPRVSQLKPKSKRTVFNSNVLKDSGAAGSDNPRQVVGDMRILDVER